MEILLIVLIGGGILLALITGIVAIHEAWQYCVIVGSSKTFIPNVFRQMSGNLIAVLGIIVLCIPAWIALSIIISIKRKNPIYKAFSKVMTDERYSVAMELIEKENVDDWDKVKEVGIEYLTRQGVPKQEAQENLDLLITIKTLSNLDDKN